MAIVDEARATRVCVLLNPAAGSAVVEAVREALIRHFGTDEAACEIRETAPDDRPDDLARDALARGFDRVVAAGGDGTVSAVANGLIGATTPLGIIPLGTANVLARELGIPVELDAACALIAGPHAVRTLDAMRVGDRHYLTQIGVGIDALMIRDTTRADKKRWGRGAYLHTACTQLLGFEPRRFTLTIDGRQSQRRASQVVIANGGILGQPPFRWGPEIRPDDGVLNVCIVRARTLLDFLTLGWHVVRNQHHRNPNVHYLDARREVEIATKYPFPVQADGEIIGETPVTVRVAAAVLRVVVPPTEPT